MKRTFLALFILLLLFVLISCGQRNTKSNDNSVIDKSSYLKFSKSGDEISTLAQSVLLANVGMAIQKGGPEYAVEYCNLKASTIIDSINQVNNCIISRISVKNRNPGNGVNDKQEKVLWDLFQNENKIDTIIQIKQKLIYYKPIKIAIPACLKCHGIPESDINPATHEKIKKLYPNDLAVGYELQDFRGLWKIEFENNQKY